MTEMTLVSQAEGVGGPLTPESAVGATAADSPSEITQELATISRRLQESRGDLQTMEQDQSAFAVAYYDCRSLNIKLQAMCAKPQSHELVEAEIELRRQKEYQEQGINNKVATLLHLRLTFADKLKDTLAMLANVQSRVLDDELTRFVFFPAFYSLFIFRTSNKLIMKFYVD